MPCYHLPPLNFCIPGTCTGARPNLFRAGSLGTASDCHGSCAMGLGTQRTWRYVRMLYIRRDIKTFLFLLQSCIYFTGNQTCPGRGTKRCPVLVPRCGHVLVPRPGHFFMPRPGHIFVPRPGHLFVPTTGHYSGAHAPIGARKGAPIDSQEYKDVII